MPKGKNLEASPTPEKQEYIPILIPSGFNIVISQRASLYVTRNFLSNCTTFKTNAIQEALSGRSSREVLIALDVSVDPPHKQIRAQITNSAYKYKDRHESTISQNFLLHRIVN